MLLTLARNMIGNLRFPVARRATSAMMLDLLALVLGTLLVLVIRVICLRNLTRLVLGPLCLNLMVMDLSLVRPLSWALLRGLLEPRNLVRQLSRLRIVRRMAVGFVLVLMRACRLVTRLVNLVIRARDWAVTFGVLLV